MDMSVFERRWPFCFHVTSKTNLPSIQATRILYASQVLLEFASLPSLVTKRRSDDVQIRVNGFDVVLRNQLPLNPTLVELDDGEHFPDYLTFLSSRVFFWPGHESGPGPDGVRMIQRTAEENQGILRIPTRSLVASNRAQPMWVSEKNAGAGWIEGGRKRRLGRAIYRRLSDTSNDSKVVECSYSLRAMLPEDCTVSRSLAGPWSALFPLV
jgi:hypothetical protein